MKDNHSTKCRMCGKTIVGSSKMGLCASCLNKTATTTTTAAGIGVAVVGIAKVILNALGSKKG